MIRLFNVIMLSMFAFTAILSGITKGEFVPFVMAFTFISSAVMMFRDRK